MGKSKRKSEGDVILPSKRSRKQADASEDEVTDEERQSSDGLFVKEKTKRSKKTTSKKRKSEPVKRLPKMVDEDEEEDGETGGGGAMETQDFLGFVEAQQKKKELAVKHMNEYMTEFTNMVEEDERVMLERVEGLDKEAQTRHTDFTARLKAALDASRPKHLPVNASPSKPHPRGTPPIFAMQRARSEVLLSNLSAIITKFTQANDLITSIQLSDFIDLDSFEADPLRVAKVLEAGKKVGMRKAQMLLTGASKEDLRATEREEERAEGEDDGGDTEDEDEEENENVDDEEEDKIENEFYGKRAGDEERGWGYMAHKAFKATRKLVKALPEVEGRSLVEK